MADSDVLYLELKKTNMLIKKDAVTDPLTGIGNRRSMEERSLYEIHRASRYGAPLSGILIDIDHFKRINDEQGHLIGDEVLKNVSSAIAVSLRTTDQLFRWGGEEFFVIAPETPQTGARNLAEKIRQTVENKVIVASKPVTVSLGVALWDRSHNIESWLERADKALYLAKNRGRNRVAVDNPPRSSWLDSKMIWNANWNSCLPKIDDAHKKLLELADSLQKLSSLEGNHEQVAQLLHELTLETQVHFQDEEKILHQVGYPDVAQHVEIHRRLLLKAHEVENNFHSGHIGPLEAYTFLMSELLMGHILTVDTRYFSYLVKEPS